MKKTVLTVLLVTAMMQTGMVWAKSLQFKAQNNSHVEFNSDAPVEVITGKTSAATGEITLDDSFRFDAKHPFKVNFAVDLSSIDTGIELRNQHMRDNFLETSKYPQATFKATSIQLKKKPDLKKPQVVDLTATGDFTVHGVTVKKTIPLKVNYTPAANGKPATVRIHGKFPVKLAEHKIKRPEAIFTKLAETIFVTLDLQAREI